MHLPMVFLFWFCIFDDVPNGKIFSSFFYEIFDFYHKVFGRFSTRQLQMDSILVPTDVPFNFILRRMAIFSFVLQFIFYSRWRINDRWTQKRKNTLPTYTRLSQWCLHRGHKYLWRQFGLPTSLNNEFQSCIRKHTSHILAIEL